MFAITCVFPERATVMHSICKHMHRHGFVAIGLIALIAALTFFSSLVRAETPPTAGNPVGNMETAAPTQIELIVKGVFMPSKSDTLVPGELPPDRSGQAVQTAIDNAIKMNRDLAAKWPKCHFHIAALVPEGQQQTQQPFMRQMLPPPSDDKQSREMPKMMEPPTNISLRVTFVAESGCLTATK